METFLEKTARYIFDRFGDQASDACIVLPNRRAGLFLKRNISKLINKPIWSPAILSIEDFVYKLTGLQETDPLKLVFDLYAIYLEKEGAKAEPFTDFLRWGEVVLKDFNDIDLYLVNPEKLYNYLSESKAISIWNPDNKPLTNFEKSYLQFYRSLASYYFGLKEKLLTKKKAYQGLAYRILAESLREDISIASWSNILFVGFNALSVAEEEIIKELVNGEKAQIIWDSDPYYSENPLQEAGFFLRRHKATFRNRPFNWEHPHFKEGKKNIELVGTAMNTGQVKAAGSILKDIAESTPEKLDNTAVILNDESLLIPMLNSLPANIPGFNVTMGLSLNNTTLFQFIESIFDLNENAIKFRKNTSDALRVYHTDIITLLNHPYTAALFEIHQPYSPPYKILDRLKKTNQAFFAFRDVAQYLLAGENMNAPIKSIFIPFGDDVIRGLQQVREVLAGLKSCFTGEDETSTINSHDKLNLEYLFHYSVMFNKLEAYVKDYPFIRDFKTFRKLYRQLVRSVVIPFYGEPLKGVQVMGMLESRTLDFENVIMLSVNEDHLPSGSTTNSIIPFEIRRTFKLPTHRERNAVFAYHFYRLLQRAKNIYLLFTTEAGDFGGGEESRFIKQIRYELPRYNPEIKIREQILTFPDALKSSEPPISIEKTQDLIQRLEMLAVSGLSASALNSFRRCSLQFYFRYVMGISETDELEETIEASTLGTVVHEVLQKIYEPYTDSEISPENISINPEKISKLTQASFAKNYPGGDIEYGKNLLIVKVAESYISNFLLKEVSYVKALETSGDKLSILELEKKRLLDYSFILDGSKKQVRLKGFIDRVDKSGNTIRIIDYKTGRVESRELKLTDWDQLVSESRYDKVFQVLFYKLLYAGLNGQEIKELEAGIISLRNLSEGFLKVRLPDDGNNVMANFNSVLDAIFSNLFDETAPFIQTENADDCVYCPFKSVCNR